MVKEAPKEMAVDGQADYDKVINFRIPWRSRHSLCQLYQAARHRHQPLPRRALQRAICPTPPPTPLCRWKMM